METQTIKKEPVLELEAHDWNNEGESEKIFLDEIKEMKIGEIVSVNSGNMIRNCVTRHAIKKVYEDKTGSALLSTIKGVQDNEGEYEDNILIWIEY